VNPSPRPRSGLVEIVVRGEGEPPHGTQVLSSRPSEVDVGIFTPHEAAVVVTQMSEIERYLDVLTDELEDDRVRVRATQTPGHKVLAHVDDIPPYGWRAWKATPLAVEAVTVDECLLDNGVVTVRVADDGTFSVGDVSGLGRLVDSGDVGDTYNWCPPDPDWQVDSPDKVVVSVLERGPLRGRLAVDASHRWQGTDVAVRTVIELRAGEHLVRVEAMLDNRTRDHRLRAWFPLPHPTSTSEAECAFAVVTRGLSAEGGPSEMGLPTFPSRRFVRAGGLTVVHEGLLEYELVDMREGRAHALAVTLLRCTGLLSNGPMSTRALPAGPLVVAEAAQMQGPVRVRYALSVDDDADPYALVDDAFVPLLATEAGGGDRSIEGSMLRVDGAEVSALRRAPGGLLELRVFNPRPDATTVSVDGCRGWLVDLRGQPQAPFEERFELGAWRIATALLDR
jgi:mannosylglycerate hydrolase